ncbi:cobalt-precorrin-4/precorrin-4 C(11)-methyltransferase [Streptoalloteichus hindustanus]|uniref:Precorrin-4/cobalt-precorrin-4 C11-methyltransferase n=1 Tax=Streptoalloteichus hindustanus TaxID=2017 RepID=A0A1M5B326_STRHI|nr:cobalt-precorrin-4/precorrin-4 C(11)-methyltransferase [Streptoalloteichus hindustanus]SHF36737.1 precorrin-4/cobalt-precorrin-4 C11-methyltransferase [Streptoalloteichus hindustanus]
MSDADEPTARVGRVSFLGAGPGAADLVTVRAARRIAEADVVVWSPAHVAAECVREHARPDAEIVDSSRVGEDDVLEIYRRAVRDRLRVVRLHSGDPTLWGAVRDQHDACRRLGLEVEIVPGVTPVSAVAAAVGRELTPAEGTQSVVLTRLEGGGALPDQERVRDLARHGTTLAVSLSAARTAQLVEELRAGGCAEDTPVVVASKATWPDELVLHTTLGELEETVKAHKLWRHTLFLIGRAMAAGGSRSRQYQSGGATGYRKADPGARRPQRRLGQRRSTSATGRVTTSDRRDDEPRRTEAGRPRPGQPDAETAWWAVRNWQENARTGGRSARSRVTRRAVEPRTLFDVGQDAAVEGGEPVVAPVVAEVAQVTQAAGVARTAEVVEVVETAEAVAKQGTPGAPDLSIVDTEAVVTAVVPGSVVAESVTPSAVAADDVVVPSGVEVAEVADEVSPEPPGAGEAEATAAKPAGRVAAATSSAGRVTARVTATRARRANAGEAAEAARGERKKGATARTVRSRVVKVAEEPAAEAAVEPAEPPAAKARATKKGGRAVRGRGASSAN